MKYFFLFVISAIAFSACKPLSEPHLSISSRLKDHYNYKPGSYWIYKDSISGIIDSVFVRDNNYQANLQRYTYTQEDISISLGEYNPIDSAKWTIELYSNLIDLLYIKLPSNSPGQEVRYSAFASLPYQLGKLPVNASDSGKVTNLFQTYGLASGLTFVNVAEMEHSGTGTNFSSDSSQNNTTFKYDNWFYVNDSVGILKMRLKNDTIHRVWELQRYNLIK